jgi:hypothetical protein
VTVNQIGRRKVSGTFPKTMCRVLLPPNSRPVQSSRLIRTRPTPICEGVGRRLVERRGQVGQAQARQSGQNAPDVFGGQDGNAPEALTVEAVFRCSESMSASGPGRQVLGNAQAPAGPTSATTSSRVRKAVIVEAARRT